MTDIDTEHLLDDECEMLADYELLRQGKILSKRWDIPLLLQRLVELRAERARSLMMYNETLAELHECQQRLIERVAEQ